MLDALTCREMEALLSALAAGEGRAVLPETGGGAASVNPGFDDARFRRLREAGG